MRVDLVLQRFQLGLHLRPLELRVSDHFTFRIPYEKNSFIYVCNKYNTDHDDQRSGRNAIPLLHFRLQKHGTTRSTAMRLQGSYKKKRLTVMQ